MSRSKLPTRPMVVVRLILDDEIGEAVEIMVRSKRRKGSAMKVKAPLSDVKAHKGGPEAYVSLVAGALAEQIDEKYKDDLDPSQIARAGQEAFADAWLKYEKLGLGRRRVTTEDERDIIIPGISGESDQ